MGKEIRVAIAGIGNCASALVQAVFYYKDAKPDDFIPGLMSPVLGEYHIRDIKFVAAFDVDTKKIGRDLSEAIFSPPNCVPKVVNVPRLGVKVLPAPILDGVAPHMRKTFSPYDPNEVEPVNVADVLKEADADILINFVPVGSEQAARYYAQACLDAKVAFINCMPTFIVSDPEWGKRFEERGVPAAGDDIKSQLGATIVHRTLARLCVERGIKILETYQLNIGGNADFENMMMEERLKTKRISKTEAVTSIIPYSVKARVGPSDYVPFLGDIKIAYIYLRCEQFLGLPLEIEVKLKVNDSPNSAGVVVDAIRATKIAIDRGIVGPLISVSAWTMKHPPVQARNDFEAKRWFLEFIEGKRER